MQRGVNYAVRSDKVSVEQEELSTILTPGSDTDAWTNEETDIRNR